jgi:hypothetical protein
MQADRNSVATLDVATPASTDSLPCVADSPVAGESAAETFTVEQYARLWIAH